MDVKKIPLSLHHIAFNNSFSMQILSKYRDMERYCIYSEFYRLGSYDACAYLCIIKTHNLPCHFLGQFGCNTVAIAAHHFLAAQFGCGRLTTQL